ncbi:hypothetical protein R3P38DRAFT_3234036 [Favolaschia claudopus]|uniref:Uncharacterized protein n=1 Tax=Favolaschia claudopus TaxID=2862362 RepID=A0AAV9ZHV4_9AGAR
MHMCAIRSLVLLVSSLVFHHAQCADSHPLENNSKNNLNGGGTSRGFREMLNHTTYRGLDMSIFHRASGCTNQIENINGNALGGANDTLCVYSFPHQFLLSGNEECPLSIIEGRTVQGLEERRPLSEGAIAGIAVAVAVPWLLLAAGVTFLCRRRRRGELPKPEKTSNTISPFSLVDVASASDAGWKQRRARPAGIPQRFQSHVLRTGDSVGSGSLPVSRTARSTEDAGQRALEVISDSESIKSSPPEYA